MSKAKPITSIPGVGSIFRPKYVDRKGVLKESANWRIRFSDGTYAATGTPDQAEAMQLLIKLAAGRADGSIVTARGTIAELLDLVLEDGKQNRSYVDKLQRVKRLKSDLGAIKISEFRRKHAADWCENAKSDKDGEALSASTKNRYMAELKRAFRLGTLEEPPLCARVPKLPRFEESDPRQGVLARDAYVRMRDAFDCPAARLLFVLAFHTGMRAGELMLIRRDQVDLAAGVIRIGSKQAKGKRARIVPLYGDMRPYIELALSGGAAGCPTLIQRDGEALTHGKLKGSWAAAAKLAGVRVLPHDMRRTALTNMIEAGIPQHEAMQISGHRSATVFQRYLISSEKTAKAVGARMAEWMQSTAEPVRKERAN